MMRKQYTAAFKTRVVQELLKEEKTLARGESELPLSLQADLLSLSRASFYYQPRPPSAEEVRLKHRIDEVYTQSPFYGSRKIAAQLQREGMGINRKTVARYMKKSIFTITPHHVRYDRH